MEASKVYYTDFRCPVGTSLLEKLRRLCLAAGIRQLDMEGKFVAIKYARTHDIPTFGICLGMQCIAIEFARNVLGYADANSREMDEKTPHNVIDIMEEQKSITNMGGTMRLGAYESVFLFGCLFFCWGGFFLSRGFPLICWARVFCGRCRPCPYGAAILYCTSAQVVSSPV